MTQADTLVSLADARDRREQHKLEERILQWHDREAQDLMAAALDVLSGRDADIGQLWTYASRYRCEKAKTQLPEGPCVAGAARLLLGHHDGFSLLLEGLELSAYDAFWLRFSQYAINRSTLSPDEKRTKVERLQQAFANGFDQGSTFTSAPSGDDWEQDPPTYLRACAYHCLQHLNHLVAETMHARARERLLRSRRDPSAILAKATYHYLMGDPQWCDEVRSGVEIGHNDPEVVRLGLHILGGEQYRTENTRSCAQAIIPIAAQLFCRDRDTMELIEYVNATHLGLAQQEIEHARHRARFTQR